MSQSIEDQVIAFFEGNLGEVEVAELLLAKEEDAAIQAMFDDYELLYDGLANQKVATPSTRSKANFEQLLKKEIATQKPAPLRVVRNYRIGIAASVAVIIGLVSWIWMDNNSQMIQMNQELMAMRTEMKSMLSNESTSMRIKAVNMSYDMQSTDTEVVDALFKILSTDESQNVRSAAIDALGNFIDNQQVKTGLIQTLHSQESEYVQIKIIKLLGTSLTQEAIPAFDKIIQNKNTSPYIKREITKAKDKIINI